MTNKQAPSRNEFMLTGPFARKGYDWWWHSFTARNEKTGEEKPFFFEFFTCNPALGGKEPIFGQHPESKAKGLRPSYLMVKAGTWGKGKAQLHRFFGWDSVKIHPTAPYSVTAEDCYCSDTESRGHVLVTPEDAEAHPEYMCDSGELSWNLKMEKQITFNVGYGASRFFRAIKAFEMYWHAEGILTRYSGVVTYNGERYLVDPETSYGYADKNWGRGFTSPWVWLSSCNMTSLVTGEKLKNCAFDIGGGRPKIYFVSLNRKLLGSLTYKGKDYEFNFSKFWTGSRTQFKSEETPTHITWYVRQETFRYVMVTNVTCLREDMIWANYEAPDGEKRHNRLWNGGNGKGEIELYQKKNGKLELIDRIRVENVGCEYGEYGEYSPV